MIVLLLESPDNVITSVLDKLYKKYPKSCRAYVSRNTLYETISSYKRPPLLMPGWLIECSEKVTVSSLQQLNLVTDNNIIVIHVTSYKAYTEKQETLDSMGILYKKIDNSKIDKKDVIEYVYNNLDISYDDAKFLYNRHNGYLKDVIHSVRVLKELGLVTRDVIKRYTLRTERCSLSDITPFLLGVDIGVAYDSMVALVYQYQYGFDFLLKFIQEQLGIYLAVFSDVSIGVLTLENYKDYKANTDNKKIKSLRDYQFARIIESHATVSHELLYTVYEYVSSLQSNREGMINLIKLLRIRR